MDMVHSLRIRLLIIFTIVVLVALGTVAFLVSRATTSEYQRSIAGIISYRYFDVNSKADAIQRAIYQYTGERTIWEELQQLIERIAATARTRVVLADLDGTVYADSSSLLIDQQINTELSKPFAAFLIEGHPILAYAEPIDTPQLEQAQRQFTSSVNRSLLLAILTAGLVAVLFTILLSKSILRPVEALIFAARRMENGDLTQRVEISAHGELGELANAFNAMADGLERLEKLRRNMVSDVAHELRTPLSNIRGYLEAAMDGLIEPTSDWIDSLHEEALLLSQLVDDLQELALAEAGQLVLSSERIFLPELVGKITNGLRPKIREKQLSLEMNFPDDLEPVYGDYRRLGQVVSNLLNNAIRYTPQGGRILISARQLTDRIELQVQDTGIGIAPEHLPFVFERFYRADASRARTTGGAGLGLAIVKQLIQAQGGDVGVDSQPGKGTTFTLTLPKQSTAAAT
jgi:signal transduction histidine kinase